MKILWISGRQLDSDLAASTEIGLFRSLTKMGHCIRLFSPGKVDEVKENHIEIKNKKIPGMITLTGSLYIRKKLPKIINHDNYDLILIDWRYVFFIRKILLNIDIPWFIIDRGPPVYKNWKLGLQKMTWSKSWKFAKNNARAGIIVSEKHGAFIQKYASLSMDFIILPSGTSFPKSATRKTYEKLKFIYVGQIDQRRDMASLIKLKDVLNRNKIKNNITVIGEGDAKEWLIENTKDIEDFMIIDKKPLLDINLIMEQFHFGLMPMPKIPVWEMSSPIKISEYARNGLIILGPKHEGNMWNKEVEWVVLSEEDEWWEDSVKKIVKMENDGLLKNYSKQAIESSEDRSWDNIAELFSKHLKNRI